MSSGPAVVRFPDGVLRYGVYNGTSDIMSGGLFDSVDEAWEYHNRDDAPEDAVRFDVEVWACYGGGFGWQAVATRWNIVDGLCPHGLEGAYGVGWVEEPRTIVREPWGWVPKDFHW